MRDPALFKACSAVACVGQSTRANDFGNTSLQAYRVNRLPRRFPVASGLPCPCCRSPKNTMYMHGPCNEHGDILASQYQIMCDDCKTSGPMTDSPTRALLGWEFMQGGIGSGTMKDFLDNVF